LRASVSHGQVHGSHYTVPKVSSAIRCCSATNSAIRNFLIITFTLRQNTQVVEIAFNNRLYGLGAHPSGTNITAAQLPVPTANSGTNRAGALRR